jgi:LysM repeat protein
LASQQPSTSVRSKRRIVVPAVAAGVAAAGVAAAVCLSGSASTAAVRPAPPKIHTAAAAKTRKAAPKHVKLVVTSKPKTKTKARTVLTATSTVWYTVHSGDSLSGIANSYYHDASAWPVLYYANQHTLNDSETIYAGQRLRIPAKPSSIPAAPAQAAPSESSSSDSSASSSSSSSSSSSASSGSSDASSSSTSDSQVDASDYSGFQACVIAAESGGDSQVTNSSGHYGLYQFSYSTWVAYGGSPSEFGDATVAEQNAVFETAMADGGESNWAPYDCC